jgi:hypothetical protein
MHTNVRTCVHAYVCVLCLFCFDQMSCRWKQTVLNIEASPRVGGWVGMLYTWTYQERNFGNVLETFAISSGAKSWHSDLVDDLVGILAGHDGNSLRWKADSGSTYFMVRTRMSYDLYLVVSSIGYVLFWGYLHAQWACRCILVVPSRHGTRMCFVSMMF